MKKLKDLITLTRLQGIKDFLVAGKILGEFDENTTVDELSNKINSMMNEKSKGYRKKLRDMKASGKEDENFS